MQFTKNKKPLPIGKQDMSKLKIQGKELRAIGYPEGPVISIAMNVMEKNFKHHSKVKALDDTEKSFAVTTGLCG